MEDHDHAPDSHTSSIPSSVTSLGVKVIVGGMKNANNDTVKDLGKALENLPQTIQDRFTGILNKLFKGDKKPTEEEIAQHVNALPPQDKELIAGQLLLNSTIGSPGTSDLKQLETYKLILNRICLALTSRGTSIALRGFLHAEDCVSYWHLERKPVIEIRGKEITINGLEIYLLLGATDDEAIKDLNQMISDDDSHQLPQHLYDHSKDDTVAKLYSIKRAELFVDRLDRNRHTKPAKEGLFEPGPDRPQRESYYISNGATSAETMVASLIFATEVLDRRGVETERIRKKILEPSED